MIKKIVFILVLFFKLQSKLLLVILAGGESKSCDSINNKLLEPIDGKPVINWVCEKALEAKKAKDIIGEIVVVIDNQSDTIKKVIDTSFKDNLKYLFLPRTTRSQKIAKAVGYAKKNKFDGVIFLFGSMPTIATIDIIKLIEEAEKKDHSYIRYEINCRPSHPVYIHKKHFSQLKPDARLCDSIPKDNYKKLAHSVNPIHIKSKKDFEESVAMLKTAEEVKSSSKNKLKATKNLV